MLNEKRFRNSCRGLGTFAALVCAGLVGGCGPAEKTPKPAEQATISGSVTVDGTKKVATDTEVEFFCTEKGATLLGRVDALGKFSLRATDKSVGVPAGRYQVMIRPPAPVAAAAPQGNSEDYKKMMMQGAAAAPPKTESDIPLKFHSQNTSKLFLEAKAGPNTFDLDLSKL